MSQYPDKSLTRKEPYQIYSDTIIAQVQLLRIMLSDIERLVGFMRNWNDGETVMFDYVLHCINTYPSVLATIANYTVKLETLANPNTPEDLPF